MFRTTTFSTRSSKYAAEPGSITSSAAWKSMRAAASWYCMSTIISARPSRPSEIGGTNVSP